jgi:hypothetical protein
MREYNTDYLYKRIGIPVYWHFLPAITLRCCDFPSCIMIQIVWHPNLCICYTSQTRKSHILLSLAIYLILWVANIFLPLPKLPICCLVSLTRDALWSDDSLFVSLGLAIHSIDTVRILSYQKTRQNDSWSSFDPQNHARNIGRYHTLHVKIKVSSINKRETNKVIKLKLSRR